MDILEKVGEATHLTNSATSCHMSSDGAWSPTLTEGTPVLDRLQPRDDLSFAASALWRPAIV
jgi:hypothetical protein